MMAELQKTFYEHTMGSPSKKPIPDQCHCCKLSSKLQDNHTYRISEDQSTHAHLLMVSVSSEGSGESAHMQTHQSLSC